MKRFWLLLLLAPLSLVLASELQISANALFDGRAMLTIEGQTRMLRVGERSPEGVTLLAASAREAVIEVDGRRITLAPSAHVSTGFSTPVRREVSIARNNQSEYLVMGTVNGRQLQFLVDTGANIIAMNSIEAKRLGIDYLLSGERSRVQTASGEVDAFSLVLDQVEVQGIVVRRVRASVIEGAYPVRPLLGMSWLARVSLREENGVLYLSEK